MNKSNKKIFLYFLFALLSSIVNLIGQHIFLNYYVNLFLAVIFGSALALVFKYILDSRFVFDGNRQTNFKTFFKLCLYWSLHNANYLDSGSNLFKHIWNCFYERCRGTFRNSFGLLYKI